MTGSVFTGPVVSAGNLLGTTTSPDQNNYAGPSLFYQGAGFIDPRSVALEGRIGGVPSHLLSASTMSVDATPAASAATPVNIAAAAATTSGTAMTLVSSLSSGIALNIPFIEFGTGILRTSAVTLDFGFTTLNVTSGSATATPANMAYFYPGQTLIIAAGTTPQANQVLTVGSSTITLAVPANATNSAAAVGQGNVLNPLSVASATAWTPYFLGGVGAVFNPADGISRGIGIAGSSSATGGAFLVSGWDIYGVPMTMTITAAAGAGPTYGTKTFKHIKSIAPQFTDSHTYSVGTSDVFGFNIRADRFDYTDIYVGGAALSASTGFTVPDATNPATSATGDVRGTIQVGSRGPLGSGASGGPMSGTVRLFMQSEIPVINQITATNANPVPLYGITQA